MASIADLTVDLRLLTASFEANAKKTRQEVSAMRASFDGLRGSLDTIGKGFAALGAAVGIRELISIGREALDAAGGLGELAQQIGISAQALQALQYSGAQVGISTEEMNTGIARLTKTIGEAEAGSKQAVDAFNALGVGVLNAQGKARSTEAILVDIARALVRITDPAKRAAAEVDLFGRAGQRLDTALADLAGGFSSLIQASQEAGTQLSDSTIAAADKASDALARLSLRIDRLKQNFATMVAGPLADLVDALNRLNAETDLNVRSFSRAADTEAAQGNFEALRDRAEQLRKQIEEIEKHPVINPLLAEFAKRDLDDLKRKLAEIKAQLPAAQGAINATRQGPFPPHPFSGDLSGVGTLGLPNTNPKLVGGAGASSADSAAKKIREVVDALQLQIANLARTDAEQETYNNLARAGVTINSAAGQQIRALSEALTEQKAALEATTQLEATRIQQLSQQDEALAASFATQRQMADAAIERQASVQQEIADNQALLAALQQSAHAYEVEAQFIRLRNEASAAGQPLIGGEIDQARQQAETLASQGEQMQQLQQQSQAVQATFEELGNAFINGITGVQTWGEVAKQVLGSVLKLILQMIAQQAALSFGSGGGAGGGGGGGGGGGILGFLGSILGFADGGRPPVGKVSVVGEEGPELWVPDSAGTIIPSDFGGGMVVNQVNHYDLRGTDISRAELDHRIEKSQRETYGAVFKAIGRGGAESKAVGRRRK